MQTLADLGWVGLGLSLLAALDVAGRGGARARRAPRDRGLPWDAERVGLATLAAVALVFGLHSAIDWTWFVPGNVVPALLCAGWVASRATLRERLGAGARAGAARLAPARRGAAALVLRDRASWRPGARCSPCAPRTRRTPRSSALEQGALAAAASIAQIAHDRNPLSVEPLFELAAIEQAAGPRRGARARSSRRSTSSPPTRRPGAGSGSSG